MLEKKYNKEIAKKTLCNGRIFQDSKVKTFLKKVDGEFEDAFESMVTEFQNHSEPILSVDKNNKLIDEAERVFGPTWDGVKAFLGREIWSRRISTRRGVDQRT